MAHQKVILLSKQTVITDWEKAARSVDAVILRIGYRGVTTGQLGEDVKYRNNLKACQVYNIPYGFTFFSSAISEKEAVEEAEWIIERIPNNSLLPLFIATDTSSNNQKRIGRSDKLSKEDRTNYTKILCETLLKAGIRVGIYGSNAWLTDQLDMNELQYPVWLIEYSKEATYDGPFVLWQYTSSANVPGISGGTNMSKEVKKNIEPTKVAEKPEAKVEAEQPVVKEEVKAEVKAEPVKETAHEGTVNVNADSLRVRTEPNGDDTGLRIPNGSKISYTEIQNGYGKLEDGTGWVNLDFVK